MEFWTKFRTRFVEASLELLWSQWSALGIATTRENTRTLVDLEALLIGTWTVGRVNPRLFDAALSWCCREGGIVHQRRLANLIDRVKDEEVATVATAWGRIVESHAGAAGSWYTSDERVTESSRSLFLDKRLEAQFEIPNEGAKVDPDFDAVGWRRAPFTSRDDVRAPELRKPENLQLFCRRFFGMGRRAEVMFPLLFGFELTTAELAEWTTYSRRSVQIVLRDLKETEVLDWEAGRGRTTRAALTDEFRKGFQQTLGTDDTVPQWRGYIEARDWASFYCGLAVLWRGIRTIEQNNYDGFKGQSILRDALENAFEFHSRTSLHAPYRPTLSVDSFEDLVREAHTYVDALFPGKKPSGK